MNSLKDDQAKNLPEFIGQAWLEEGKVIVLKLRAQHGSIVGHSTLRYPLDHPQYDDIMRHIGGLEEGKIKAVRPWP